MSFFLFSDDFLRRKFAVILRLWPSSLCYDSGTQAVD